MKYSIGDRVYVDANKERAEQPQIGEVRGIQDLEPPVSYLLKFEDGSNEWVSSNRLTST